MRLNVAPLTRMAELSAPVRRLSVRLRRNPRSRVVRVRLTSVTMPRSRIIGSFLHGSAVKAAGRHSLARWSGVGFGVLITS